MNFLNGFNNELEKISQESQFFKTLFHNLGRDLVSMTIALPISYGAARGFEEYVYKPYILPKIKVSDVPISTSPVATTVQIDSVAPKRKKTRKIKPEMAGLSMFIKNQGMFPSLLI